MGDCLVVGGVGLRVGCEGSAPVGGQECVGVDVVEIAGLLAAGRPVPPVAVGGLLRELTIWRAVHATVEDSVVTTLRAAVGVLPAADIDAAIKGVQVYRATMDQTLAELGVQVPGRGGVGG